MQLLPLAMVMGVFVQVPVAVRANGAAAASNALTVSGAVPVFDSVTVCSALVTPRPVVGKGTLVGPALGAVIFTFLPELLREASQWRMIVFSIILIVTTLFMPRGIIFPVIEHLVPKRWRTRHVDPA